MEDVCVQNSKELLGSSLTYKNVLWRIFAASGNYMTLVYIICLTPYLVSEHLNYALRSVIKYELCAAKRSHFVNRMYSGDFLSWNCLLIKLEAEILIYSHIDFYMLFQNGANDFVLYFIVQCDLDWILWVLLCILFKGQLFITLCILEGAP